MNQPAAQLVDEATKHGPESEEEPEPELFDEERRKAAQALGRRGGLKGGRARAEKLTAKRRSEIGTMAAKKRWKR